MINQDILNNLIAKVLRENPDSGILHAEAIFLASKHECKTRSVDALKVCENDSNVLLAVSKLFWSESNSDKARQWFLRTVKLDP